jgi:ribokinase
MEENAPAAPEGNAPAAPDGAAGVGILKTGALRFRAMVGTGGIGAGSFFQLSGDDTLGREESRGGRFLDRRDYCKLHIVSHYVKILLGDRFPVFPIGKVGDDEAGSRLRAEMEAIGLDLRFVETVAEADTLFSFCFLYPDGTGGNMTTEDSASARVDPNAVAAADALMRELGPAGIALAVPEVPLAARGALLDLAGRHGLYRAASFTRAEMVEARDAGLFGMVDLLAVNLEEAATAAAAPARSVEKVIAEISSRHPMLCLSITAGAAGSWCWDGESLAHEPALPVKAEGTAGAGDAHLAGMLAGLAAGLELAEAQQLAATVAAASVTSPHAIHPELDSSVLLQLHETRKSGSPRVSGLLRDPETS